MQVVGFFSKNSTLELQSEWEKNLRLHLQSVRLVPLLSKEAEQARSALYRNSTLERLNMLYPVNTDIKLYLISILLKMDSEAKLQLMIETMLQDPNTTKETRDYIEGILNTIRDQSKPKPKWFAYLDMSYTQTENSNIDGVSKSGNLYAQNNVSEFPGIKYDKTYSRGGSITVGKNLDPTSAISFNGSLSINTQNKGDENENDLTSGSISYSKILGKHYLLPYIFYSRPNERSSADLNTKGIVFNNTSNINNNNSNSYSSSLTIKCLFYTSTRTRDGSLTRMPSTT